MSQAQVALLPTAGIAPDRSLEDALLRIFPTPQAETRLQQARRIMGDEIDALSDAELTEHLTQFQYLIDQWLDEFERQTFEGSTLRQVLGG